MFRQWRVALQTAALVVALVVLKVGLAAFDLEFINLSPLYTSIVAGGIFVIGLIVAGTLADYKEAEKVPADMASALEAILEDGRSIRETSPEFDLERLKKSLVRVVDTFRSDLAAGSTSCLEAINALSESFEEMERLGIPRTTSFASARSRGSSERARSASITSSERTSCRPRTSSS